MRSLFFLKICVTVNILKEEKELKCKSPIELYRKLFSVIVNSFENPFHPSEDIYRRSEKKYSILCSCVFPVVVFPAAAGHGLFVVFSRGLPRCWRCAAETTHFILTLHP